jgi:DNA mismatch endonuclease Vsr
MADVFSKAKRSQVMSRILSVRNERTEQRLVSIFKKHRITGWRRRQKLSGSPDFIFSEQRVCIFVDGCFWHCCPLHGRIPTSNTGYWRPKLKRTQLRDKLITSELRKRGWAVVRFWQHDLSDERQVICKLSRVLKLSQQPYLAGASREKAAEILSKYSSRTAASRSANRTVGGIA